MAFLLGQFERAEITAAVTSQLSGLPICSESPPASEAAGGKKGACGAVDEARSAVSCLCSGVGEVCLSMSSFASSTYGQ